MKKYRISKVRVIKVPARKEHIIIVPKSTCNSKNKRSILTILLLRLSIRYKVSRTNENKKDTNIEDLLMKLAILYPSFMQQSVFNILQHRMPSSYMAFLNPSSNITGYNKR